MTNFVANIAFFSMQNAILLQESPFFSALFLAYIQNKTEVQPLFDLFPTLENFDKAVEKIQQNKGLDRQILADTLQKRYIEICPLGADSLVFKNIEKLRHANTYTVCTGHQLNLATGPIYSWIKILQTIKLARQLQEKYPQNHYVPVFWLASEDHDFLEVNHFFAFDKKAEYAQNQEVPHAVGSLPSVPIAELFAQIFSEQDVQQDILQKMQAIYTSSKTWAEAHFRLLHDFFQAEGLVLIEPNDAVFKKAFAPFVQKELQKQVIYNAVTETQKAHFKTFELRVNPRPYTLFYLDKAKGRVRIDDAKPYLDLVLENPENFSPNVLFRPIYQQFLLPNLAYIGGAAEVDYWLELKTAFEAFGVFYPILVPRNHFIFAKDKQLTHLQSEGLTVQDLFLDEAVLQKKWTQAQMGDTLKAFPLEQALLDLSSIYNNMQLLVQQIDGSLLGRLEATHKQQSEQIAQLYDRLRKSEQQKQQNRWEKIHKIQSYMFPKDAPRERSMNALELLLGNENLRHDLLEAIEPLELQGFRWYKI
jgi:bacillithiol biosynthesis cysteine-adding enzyme BshC